MKNALLVVLAATAGLLIVGFTPTRKADDASTFRGRTAQQWYQRAAVRRDQRDDLQLRLTRRVRQVHRLERRLANHDVSPIVAIRLAFGPYADQAIRVADCETGGTFSVYASNHGTYLGLFQFGPYARATYGFDWTALGQAQAAYRYFKASGYRWTAWECKP